MRSGGFDSRRVHKVLFILMLTITEVAMTKDLTTGQAAKLCRVSQQKMIRLIDTGYIKGSYRVPGSRFRLIPREVLDKFMKDNDIPTNGFFLEPQLPDYQI
jgi:excisionase family DNA binding protein